VVASAPWEQGIGAFGQLTLGDLECALSANHAGLFSIVEKYPALAALTRGGLLGLAAEATSERIFSYSGLLFSKLLHRMGDSNIRTMAVGREMRVAAAAFIIAVDLVIHFLKSI
jgi:hypothetical protein